MQDYFACFPILISIIPDEYGATSYWPKMKWILPFFIEVKILGIFRQAVEISRQHVVAQGQLVGDLLQGEGPFIPRFDQFAPIRNAPARFHVEDDARLPARRMSGPVEIEVAFIEERQVFPVVQGNRVMLFFRQA